MATPKVLGKSKRPPSNVTEAALRKLAAHAAAARAAKYARP
jgi:hypothetical protein